MSETAGRFREWTGRECDGVWAAPGRVNVIGEHTDYNDGFVLPMALPMGTTVTAAARDDGVFRALSTEADESAEWKAGSAPGEVSGWAAYVAGVAWALREGGHRLDGADLLVTGDLPLGAGLSSSAALECATALALADLAGLGLDRTELAMAAQRAENDYVGMPCGVMDQMVAMHGQAGHLLFLDTRSLEVQQVPGDLAGAGLTMLVVDTGVQHSLVDGEYADRRRACERAAAALGVSSLRDAGLPEVERLDDDELRRRARHVVTENQRVTDVVALLRAGRIADIGASMTASHESLRDDYEVSSRELDATVAASLEAGALGARMTGAGFGGCAVVLAHANDVDPVTAAAESAFEQHGWDRPTLFTATPADGARRIG